DEECGSGKDCDVAGQRPHHAGSGEIFGGKSFGLSARCGSSGRPVGGCVCDGAFSGSRRLKGLPSRMALTSSASTVSFSSSEATIRSTLFQLSVRIFLPVW